MDLSRPYPSLTRLPRGEHIGDSSIRTATRRTSRIDTRPVRTIPRTLVQAGRRVRSTRLDAPVQYEPISRSNATHTILLPPPSRAR